MCKELNRIIEEDFFLKRVIERRVVCSLVDYNNTSREMAKLPSFVRGQYYTVSTACMSHPSTFDINMVYVKELNVFWYTYYFDLPEQYNVRL